MADATAGGKQHNLRRSAKNRASGKGKAHVVVTQRNKEKHRAKNKKQGDPLEPINYCPKRRK